MDELVEFGGSAGKPNRTRAARPRVNLTLSADASCCALGGGFHTLQSLGLLQRQSGLPKIVGGLLRKPHLGGTAAIAPEPAFDA